MRHRIGLMDPPPPRVADFDGRGRWVWLVTAKDIFEAELLKGMLENANVPVYTSSFDASPTAWMFPGGNPCVPVKLFVPNALLEAARLELLESSLVAAGRMTDGVVVSASQADPDQRVGTHPVLRERIRPFLVLVSVLTTLAVAWFIVSEVFNFAPCESKLLCVERGSNPRSFCEPLPSAMAVRKACPINT